jgi:subfamily B ATP-binding cassette protein MsbA
LLYVLALIWISPLLGGGTLLLGMGGGLIVSRLYRHFNWLGSEMTASSMDLSKRAAEAFNGVRVVRAAHAQRVMAERFERANFRQAEVAERYQRASAVLQPILETGSLVIAISLLLGAFTYLVSRGAMSPAKLTAFGLVLLRLVPLVNRYFGIQAHLLYLSGGIREIAQWLDTAQFPVRPYGTEPFEDVRERISIVGLGYRYRDDQVALDDVSFDIPSGSTVALVGQSGSGKSTLATLLLRLREPTSGRVLVDGRDYWSFSPESWHRHVALVEQEPFLFNDSLGANVAFGWDGASTEDIEFALHAAYLDDFLNSLPDRLETPIGERGVMLSGGQRQRLSIARAILRNPRLLILDEATSHLDTVSEEFVQAALEAATRGRTTLVIAHRLSTVRRAHHIVVLVGGRVVEQGTWDELAAADGAFAALLRRGFDGTADTAGLDQPPAADSAAR